MKIEIEQKEELHNADQELQQIAGLILYTMKKNGFDVEDFKSLYPFFYDLSNQIHHRLHINQVTNLKPTNPCQN